MLALILTWSNDFPILKESFCMPILFIIILSLISTSFAEDFGLILLLIALFVVCYDIRLSIQYSNKQKV
jgi:hypothetical protein